MPVLLWLARLLGAMLTLLVHVALASALFLLSAHLFVVDPDELVVPAYGTRGIAAIWLWAAFWNFLKYGVLQRTKPIPDPNKKASGAEVATSSVGCLASIGAMAVTGWIAGAWADWAYQGVRSGDPTHPARIALDRAIDGAEAVAQDPGQFFRYYVIAAVILITIRVIRRVGAKPGTGTVAQAPQDVRESKRKRREKARAQGSTSPPASAQSHPSPTKSTAFTGISTGPTSAPRTSNSGRTIDDPMLGSLRRDETAGGWRLANPRSDVGSLVILAADEPTPAQMEMGRSLVQRSFEALLRASEAARPKAQADGVGLPRFTVAESVVGLATGAHPSVTMRLRCEGNAARVYEVKSDDGMHTFKA